MAIMQSKAENTFGGWSTDDKLIDWKEFFDVEYNDDGEIYLVTKKTYSHDEPESNLVFEYKYCVNAVDMLIRSGDPKCNNILIYLHMIPLPKYWNEKELKEAAYLNGWEDMPRDELLEAIGTMDAVQNGSFVKVMEDSVEYDLTENEDGFYDVLENEAVVNKLNLAATIIDCVDSFRGFFMDKPWNAIGTTGWDSLYGILSGEDPILKSIDRFRDIASGE